MAVNIICISPATYRDGVNNVGDVVAVHDDDRALGPAYDSFWIVNVNATKAQTEAALATVYVETDPHTGPKYKYRITGLTGNTNMSRVQLMNRVMANT